MGWGWRAVFWLVDRWDRAVQRWPALDRVEESSQRFRRAAWRGS